jgi:hypothetical protein
MNAKERFITALGRGKADRLPVTTHHVMPSFLESHLDGISNDDFFNAFGLDPIKWVMAYRYGISGSPQGMLGPMAHHP